MKRSLFPALALSIITGCSGQLSDDAQETDITGESTSKIIGGTVDHGDPSVVYLTMGCAGSVISSTVILTAAHCLDHGPFEVRTGTYGEENPTSHLPIKEYHVHPSFDPDAPPARMYDIAVVILAEPTSLPTFQCVAPYSRTRTSARASASSDTVTTMVLR